MKKITLLALLMAGALCASAANPISKTAKNPVPQSTPIKVTKVVKPATNRAVPEGYAEITLTIVDNPNYGEGAGVWGDGSGYQMLFDADATAYGSVIPTTGALTTGGDADASVYAEFEYKIPEAADGSCTTTNVIVSGSQSILIPAGVYDWVITNPTPDDRVWIASSNNFPGRYDDYEFVSKGGYEFIVSFGGENDQTELVITDPLAPGIPTELAVDPAATTADVTWTPGENNETFNLRYAEYDETGMEPVTYGFDSALDPWTTIDADGDGQTWTVDNGAAMSGSYISGVGALTPDNWLISPAFKLGGSVTFNATNYSSYYAEQFAVYVCKGEYTSVEDFVQIGEVMIPGTTATAYEVDLSDYDGVGYFAFRNFGTEDEWKMYIDDVVITPGVDWIYKNDIPGTRASYALEGLTPNTKYALEVQGVSAEGRESSWSDMVIFTTLDEGQEEPVYYVVGFNDWGNPIEIGEEGATVTVATQDFENEEDTAQEFKLITYDADGATVWFGGADDNGVGYFEITEELLDGEISLDTPGANFRLPEAGTYTIKLVEVPIKTAVEGIKMIVTKESTTAIESIKSDVKGDNNYYNLMGQKVSGNLPAGIYIHNGKKVVIK